MLSFQSGDVNFPTEYGNSSCWFVFCSSAYVEEKFGTFFSIIILITQTYKIKNITITRYYCMFPAPGKNKKIN